MENRLKPRVILSQLNIYDNSYTVPLACGYLKAMAYKSGLLKNIDIEILNRDLNNRAGDSVVISYITKRQPSIVSFSCNVWNTERTIYIINQIKARLPQIKIICGGSETSWQYKKIIRNRNIDIIVIGEGELIFVELLKNFLFGTPKLKEIKSIVFRKNGKVIVTPKREQIPDINIIPSPYLLGFIDPKEYGRITIENYRGCIGKCTYCNWRRNFQGIRYFAAERIRDEIKLAREKKVYCYIIDPIFNLPNNLLRFSKVIREADHDKSMKFHVEGRAEYINENTIKLLSQCNITNMNIGLQSLNQTALDNVKRWFNKKLFVRGLNLLKKANIIFRLDLIIGLPGDTLDSIKKAIRFVEKHTKKRYFEILHVPPETELRRQAKKFNLKYIKKKPYYVLSTNELSRHDFRKLCSLCRDTKNYLYLPDDRNLAGNKTAHKFLFSPQGDYEETSKPALRTQGANNIISNIVLEIDNTKQTVKEVKSLAIELSKSVASKVNIYFKCIRANNSYHLLKEFLYQISKSNPFSKFNIIIENNESLNFEILRHLQKAIVHTPTYHEYRKKFYKDLFNIKNDFQRCNLSIIQPFSKKNPCIIKKVSKDILIIPSISISEDIHWKKALLELLNSPRAGVLINLKVNSDNLSYIAKVLKYIYKYGKKKNKSIFFSDYVLQLFYNEISINKETLSQAIRNFKHSKMLYIDEYFTKTFLEYNVASAALKLTDINNSYKINTE